MPKFFVNQNQIKDNEIEILGSDVNHIKNVLRLDIGKKISICERETSKNFDCIIKKIEKDSICCEIFQEILKDTEASTYIHIFQGLPKADKLEWIIEKSTEIGVKEVTPVIMERSIVKLNEKDKNNKISRWRKIAEVASKQSGRDRILIVNDIINFKNLLEKLREYDIVIIAYEKEEKQTLKSVLRMQKKEMKKSKIAVLIGPEGGISHTEISKLTEVPNAQIVTLGKRILRTETAPLVVASNIIYEMEE